MKESKKKHQFQIRKVPLKRFIPQKTPQLNALDVHSICLPSKKVNWASLHHNGNSRNYEQDFNRQIMSSRAYQELYSQYMRLREERMKQKIQISKDIDAIEKQINEKKEKHQQLLTMRDSYYSQIESLRDELTEHRDKNYNLRWEVYNQRGTQYANLYGYPFLDPHELTYEQLLQIQQQIGSVNKGLTLEEIEQLDKRMYKCEEGAERQICCICYDDIGNEEWVTVLVCKHTHHCECIRDWLLKQKICPICKKEVSVESPLKQKNVSREEVENPQN